MLEVHKASFGRESAHFAIPHIENHDDDDDDHDDDEHDDGKHDDEHEETT